MTPPDIEIQNSELHELTFWNAPKQSVVIRKFATDTTTPLAGVAARPRLTPLPLSSL